MGHRPVIGGCTKHLSNEILYQPEFKSVTTFSAGGLKLKEAV